MINVYHLNISSASGAISLNIVNEDWCLALTLRTILISLQALLSSPYPNDPLDADVAKHYMTSKQSFDESKILDTYIYMQVIPQSRRWKWRSPR